MQVLVPFVSVLDLATSCKGGTTVYLATKSVLLVRLVFQRTTYFTVRLVVTPKFCVTSVLPVNGSRAFALIIKYLLLHFAKTSVLCKVESYVCFLDLNGIRLRLSSHVWCTFGR